MSIGLLVTYRKGEEKTEYLPLALENDFQRFWLPVAKTHNLDLISQFANGISLTIEEVPAVLEELDEMRAAILPGEHHDEVKTEMLDRLERLKLRLENLTRENVEDIFIG
jgi:hypothetical protein